MHLGALRVVVGKCFDYTKRGLKSGLLNLVIIYINQRSAQTPIMFGFAERGSTPLNRC